MIQYYIVLCRAGELMQKHTKAKYLLSILMIILIGLAIYFAKFNNTKTISSQNPRIAISFADTANAWNVAALKNLLETFEKYNFSSNWKSADGSVTQQKEDIQNLLTEKPEYLIVMPAKSIGLKEILEEAAEKTKVILYHGEVTGLNEKAIYLRVDENAFQQGTLCASYLGDFFQSQNGRILELQCKSGNSEISKRTTGFRNELCRYPGLEIENVIDDLDNRIDAYNAVVSYLTDGTQTVDAIFAHTDELGMGALAALETLNMQKSIPIISIGGIQDVIKAIRSGDYFGCIDVSPYIGGQLIQVLNKQQHTKTIYFETKGYTYENINETKGY